MRGLIYSSLFTLLAVTGCGDATSSQGEEGRLLYTLYTDYEVPQGQLTDARIITGHQQRLQVSLTSRGLGDVTQPNRIQHNVVPFNAGIQIISDNLDSASDVPEILINVAEPGTYTLESTEDGTLVDRIDLTFERPGSFQLITQMREPWAETFRQVQGEIITVEEGSQVTFQAVPIDSSGERLAGDMQTDMTLDDVNMAVPGQGVLQTFEDGVWSVGGEVNFYFINEGQATFTVSDPVSQAIGTQAFTVTPIATEL